MAKRKTPKQARKGRGPLPLLPVTISASLLWLPLEALRDPIFCPPGSEQQAFLLNALIDAHNQIHAPIIRQAEAQQTGRRKGAKQGQEKQQETALERGRKIAKIVEQHKLRKNAWQAAVEAGLAPTAEAAKQAYYRYLKSTR
ncbi:MAG TPA: hypothetical protein DDY91_02635 [Planctomycetaceae bacterium]|jgi:hypothetical protein|nr:hypothetical protein [Planctomycetaceae bacterium]